MTLTRTLNHTLAKPLERNHFGSILELLLSSCEVREGEKSEEEGTDNGGRREKVEEEKEGEREREEDRSRVEDKA